MAGRHLAPGENAGLPDVWRLTVSPAVPLLMVTLDGADQVFGDPVPVVAQALSMSPSMFDPGVQRCLLVAHGTGLPPVGCELDLEEQALEFRPAAPAAGAQVLLEFYRRGAGWKVRALGQVYAGGLPELGRVHGAVLADPTAGTSTPRMPTVDSSADVSGVSAAGASTVDSSAHAERIVRQLGGIWEDAARSLVAFAESMSFADQRRDAELGALLADPARRRADDPGRADIERRHANIADTASARRLGDLDQLAGELATLAAHLPAPVADWTAPAWQQALDARGTGIFRLGTLSRPDSRMLRIPLVHGVSAIGGICLENPSGVIDQSVLGVLYRLLAAVPAGTGVSVIADDDRLAGFLGLSAALPGSGSERLTDLARQVDLRQMAAEAGVAADVPGRLPGVLILPWPALGFDDEQVAVLDRIGANGALLGIRTIYLASRSQLGALPLRQQPRYLPVVRASVTDPWTGLGWDFEPDDGVTDAAIARRITERAGRTG